LTVTQYIVSSGVQSGITLNNGDTMSVFSTGTASDITIFGGGQEIVYDGGKSTLSVVSGTRVMFGGITTITNGLETVSAGGTSYDTKVRGLGHEVVLSGGAALNTSVEGTLYVSSGGSATSTTIFANGNEIVSSGGKETGTVVSNGRETVLVGGKSDAAQVLDHGTQIVKGLAVDTSLEEGVQDIEGGTASSTAVVAYGEQYLDSGSSVDTYLEGGYGDVYQFVYGGVASFTTVLGTGYQEVYSGGSSVGTKIEGGLEDVEGIADVTTVGADGPYGGALYVYSGGEAIGTRIVDGFEIVSSGGTTRDTFIDGGVLTLTSGAKATGGITFESNSGTLLVHEKGMPDVVISGFEAGDNIDLAYVTYSAGDSVSVNTPGIVTVSAGGKTYNLHIAGAKVGETDFSFGSGSILTRGAADRPGFLQPAASAAMAADGWGRDPVVVPAVGGEVVRGAAPVMSNTGAAGWLRDDVGAMSRDFVLQAFGSQTVQGTLRGLGGGG